MHISWGLTVKPELTMLNDHIESEICEMKENMLSSGLIAKYKRLGMNINKKAMQLKRLAELIELRQSGGVANIGRIVGLQTKEVRELLDEIRTMGIDICFDRKERTYYYASGKRLSIQLPVSVVEEYVWMN